MDKSQALRKLKKDGTSFESIINGYIIQVGKQVNVYEDGYKGPKVLSQAQQNKLLAVRPTPKPVDARLMYVDDDNSTEGQDNDADDEKAISEINMKPKVMNNNIKF
ncbi:MAG: hypothetical protein EZS28_015750 [Streblomastix strix]|uniref:Uncharacterized protein n=1 Tax=Streblomastix strix TaxID=222440 RepID=A0A5J4W1A5_9EUKA|nr:MAG: hypothetical protein EZS28_015750 [Streblomastix strix]